MKARTIWITGASSGIGRALAHGYAEHGNTLILSGRNEAGLVELSLELSHRHCKTLIQVLDVTDNLAIHQAIEHITSSIGKIDILINSAGVSQRSLVSETHNEVGRKIMDVNFFGTVNMCKQLLPYMAQHGSFVVMSSAAGKFGFSRRAYYSASKHALHGFFDSWRIELKERDINILIVCPGRINTNISINALMGDGSKFEQDDHRLKEGWSSERCSGHIKRAIEARKKEIYLGGKEVIMIYIKRFSPPLYRYIANRLKIH